MVQPRRARTEEQKFERRRLILAAADRHFRDVGYEAFSMARLARLAGLAKGTLYLYFETREDVFLSLCTAQLERWGEALAQRLEPGMSLEAFAHAFIESAQEDEILLPLLLRLDSVIEHNVSIDKLIVSKRAVRDVLLHTAEPVARALDFTPDQAFDAISSCGSLLIGAARLDEGPALEDEVLPDDVRQIIETFSANETFVKNACRILAGIRAGI